MNVQEPKAKDIVKILRLNQLKQSPYQGRLMDITSKVDDKLLANQINELAQSIEQSGLMQPIIVRPEGEEYEIIDGHRRVMAMRKLGRGQIKAIIKECSEREAQIMSVIGNLQRKNLNSIEQAIAYKKLLDTKIFKDKRELSNAIGKDETFVGDLINTLNMDTRIIDDLAKKNLIKDIRILRVIRKIEKTDKNGVSDKQWGLYKNVIWEKLSRNKIKDLLKESREKSVINSWDLKSTTRGITVRISTTSMSKKQKDQLIKWVEEKLNEFRNRI